MASNKAPILLEAGCKRIPISKYTCSVFSKGVNWRRLWIGPGIIPSPLVRLLLLAVVGLQLLSVCVFLGDVADSVYSWRRQKVLAPATAQALPLTAVLQNSYPPPGRVCHLGKSIYVYDLPSEFNSALLANCSTLVPWTSFCPSLSNAGLGPSARDSVLPWLQQLKERRAVNNPQRLAVSNEDLLELSNAWHNTDQFTGEMIFHSRILEHPCRTQDPHQASAFYIPFYAGLDISRYLWTTSTAVERDQLASRLLEWLGDQHFFKRSSGRNHFLMVGRITWDFRRTTQDGWGSSFFYMPGMANVTRLLIERNPWDEREMGVPYPTGFHPRSERDLRTWQSLVKGAERTTLFSFAGIPRSQFRNDFRGTLLEQCRHATNCRSISCDKWKCEKGNDLMDLFLDSIFCLQPRGDSFSRRSIFDSLVAGCIPVLFWKQSAYQQYLWHLPKDSSSYSVFISKDDVRGGTVIEDVLRNIPMKKVKKMQRTILQLIPKIVYAGAGNVLEPENDAFDVTIRSALQLTGQR